MYDDVIDLLKAHEYFRGVSDTTLGETARLGTITNYEAAADVHQLNDPLSSICFVLRGRLKSVRVDSRGEEHLFQIFERGEQYGMILGGLGESIPVRIFALEPSMILSLDHEKSMELVLLHPDLRRQWLQSYARSLRRRLLEPAAGQVAEGARNAPPIPGDAQPRSEDHWAPARVGRSGMRSQRRGLLAVDTRCGVPFTVERRPAYRGGRDTPTNG